MKNNKELADIEEELKRRNLVIRMQATHLRENILHIVKNGGFCLEKIWSYKEVNGYKYIEILAMCEQLKNEGLARFNPDTHTYIVIGED